MQRVLRRAIGLSLIALFTIAPVKAAEINLTLAHTWPKGFPIFATSVDDYAQLGVDPIMWTPG